MTARGFRTALLALLVASAVLRVWLALPEPHAGRWWDERFNVANLGYLLETGDLRPRNYWYGALSYLPQAAVLAVVHAGAAAAGVPSLAVHHGGELTPAGYRLCRLLQVAYGVASLWVLFLIGRELFAPEVGLLAAFLLATSERHVHASAIFKPDILLLLTSLLAFLWSVRAARSPGRRSTFALAGVGVGLAAASKLNGVTIALPLVLAGAVLARHNWRRWLDLGLAGAAAAAVYLAFNPFVGKTLRYLERNRVHYEYTGTGTGWEVLRDTLGYVFDPAFHGPVVALLAVLGAAWLARRLLAERSAWGAGLPLLMLLAYPLTYYLVYSLATTRAKANHFLQILPFTSLLAAAAAVAGWRWLAPRLSVTARRGALLAVAAPLALWLAGEPLVHVYRQVTRETRSLAIDALRRTLPEPRAGRAVHTALQLMPEEGLGSAEFPPEELIATPEASLDLADAEVFPAAELDGPRAEFYRRRLAAAAASVRVERRWFRAWGPDLVVLLHPWRFDREMAAGTLSLRRAEGGALTSTMPAELARGELVSVQVKLPVAAHKARATQLTVGARRLPLGLVSKTGRSSVYLSPRFRVEAAGSVIALALPAHAPQRGAVEITVRRWQPPAALP